MRDARNAFTLASLKRQAAAWLRSAPTAFRLTLSAALLLQSLAFLPSARAATPNTPADTNAAPATNTTKPAARPQGGAVMSPTNRGIEVAPPINLAEAARQEALGPAQAAPSEIKPVDAPKGRPDFGYRGVPIDNGYGGGKADGGVGGEEATLSVDEADQAPLPSATGPSPGPSKTFKGEFETGTSIPPDTHGAVGTTHVFTVSNERIRIQSRDGVELVPRVTITSFWAGATVKGASIVGAFDTKVFFDRFNNRFILVSSFNSPTAGAGVGQNSGMGVAVSQTADPTGLWNRYTAAADPTSTSTAGHAIDYPSVGFNKNWIVVNENTFNFSGTAFTNYWGAQIFIFDKQAAYAGTLSSVSLFEDPVTNCTSPFEGKLGCGFTMAPTINEENTTDTVYMAEDWDNIAGQLRLSKITGTPAAPILTVGTQFPQSTLSWQFSAARIGTTGGYAPQRQQQAYLPSGTRIMTNDSRIQNCVLRNGTLWTTHTVMLSATPTPAGSGYGTTNPDIRAGVQWWAIDPTIETGASPPPLQRARIEDPTADNCHNGAAGTRTDVTCNSTALQKGEFFAFPNISVNKNNDVLIGYTKFSPLTYPNAAYSMRLAADAANTLRDQVVFRPGQANYNIGAGTGGTTSRQNRWGDYSAAQTDPLDDTTFWTVQEYSGWVRDFGIGLAGNWETWWAQVKPSTPVPAAASNLIISEFRLRGPQGANDEFIEVYNPSTSSVVVNSIDNSDGWAVGFFTGTAGAGNPLGVIPNGTVIPGRGHFLVARNPDAGNGPTLSYSLNGYPAVTVPPANTTVRGADSDTGYAFDNADNNGVAIFKSANTAALIAANVADAAGFVSAPAPYKEGTGIPNITAGAVTGQITFVRNQSSGTPQDTNDNAADFQTLNTLAPTETLGVAALLGAPGPENLDGPILNNNVNVDRLDTSVSINSAPNRVRDLTPVTNGALGTLSMRRNVYNNTGTTVTRVRFRIRTITTFPAPAGVADLRALSSGNISVMVNNAFACGATNIDSTNPNIVNGPCTAFVRGTTVEEPPTQSNGGGWNTTMTVALPVPLPPGKSVNVQFVFGVQVGGSFSVIINTEALP